MAVPFALSADAFLVPSAGASFIGALSGNGGAEFGGHLGLAVLMLGDASSGLHVGVTWHRFSGLGEAVWLVEFGYVRR